MDAMSEAPRGRVLVHAGKWLVPVAERPKNWRAILDETEAIPSLDAMVAETEQVRLRTHQTTEHFEWYRREFFDVVNESGAAFGAEDSIITAGHMLIIGMFCRDAGRIATEMDFPGSDVGSIAARYLKADIWRDEMTVYLGGEDDHGDMKFWLIAMAGAGAIEFSGWKDDEIMFRARVGQAVNGGRA